MLVKTFGCAVHGIKATLVTIETNISGGVFFFLVGLPDSAVKESQHRIGAALKNIGHKIPGKGVTINMAPADIKKKVPHMISLQLLEFSLLMIKFQTNN